MNCWDITLLIVVSIQATSVAYARTPQTKALLVTFPLPTSFAYLALGQPVDATNMLGLALLMLFTHIVRWLHVFWNQHIIVAIVCAAFLYTLLGCAIAHLLPCHENGMFWMASGAVLLLGWALLWFQPPRDEPSHRSPLPIHLKLPIIMAVITGLILGKHWLQGFMTVFPMVGVVAAYEARHSLWTMSRQMSVIMLTIGVMLIAMHLAQPHTGQYGALAIGWLVFACALSAVLWTRNILHDKLK